MESLNELLEYTKKMRYPFFSNSRKRENIYLEYKEKVDRSIKNLQANIDETELRQLWDDSIKYADEELEIKDPKDRYNDFYLQEQMHMYVNLIVNMYNN